MRGLATTPRTPPDRGIGAMSRVQVTMESKAKVEPAVFVGASFQVRSAVADDVFAYPVDTRPGDVAYSAWMYNDSASPGGWTMLSNWAFSLQLGQWMRHGFKVLTAADIAYPATLPYSGGNGGLGLVTGVWRGPTQVVSRGFVEGGGAGESALTFPGAVPAQNGRGVFSLAIDRDVTAATWRAANPFVTRGIAGTVGSGIYGIGLATWNGRKAYAGEAVYWNGFNSSHSQAAGLLELI